MNEGLPQVLAEPLGGSALVRAGIAGRCPDWYTRRPTSPDEWRARAAQVVATSSPGGGNWLDAVGPAFAATGAAQARLARVAAAGGVVVTTGQQPGLFGGPVYTLSKALTALELADAIEAASGVPVAPVFWAATDDADFAEAAATWLHRDGGAVRVAQDQLPTEGIPMSEVPLEGIGGAIEQLLRSVGSAADASVVDAVRHAYAPGATVGGAYVQLMRHLLEPLGIAVVDASHPALVARERDLLLAALRQGPAIAAALAGRDRALRGSGYDVQVPHVEGLSLVFARVNGRKVRVPLSDGEAVVAGDGVLTPNVLLRPVAERQVLPTVAYVAGPGEFAYFAQVSAVAAALGVEQPLAVPRWSCTLLEPHVEATLAVRGVSWRELEVEHAVERRLAVASLPLDLMSALDGMRRSAQAGGDAFKERLIQAGSPIDPRMVEGTVRGMMWRVDRLERRLVAAAKQREHRVMHELATARGSLFPGGKRQERALSFIPFLAAYGTPLLDRLRASARRHTAALVHGHDLPVDP